MSTLTLNFDGTLKPLLNDLQNLDGCQNELMPIPIGSSRWRGYARCRATPFRPTAAPGNHALDHAPQ